MATSEPEGAAWGMGPANLLDDAGAPASGERFDTLLRHRQLHIERIVSAADVRSEVFVQQQDEWVLLLRGEALLDVAGEPHALKEGDHVFLPAGTAHQ